MRPFENFADRAPIRSATMAIPADGTDRRKRRRRLASAILAATSIDAMAREFHIFDRRVTTGSSFTLDHTAITYAFHPQGHLRLAIGHEETAAELSHDVEALPGTT